MLNKKEKKPKKKQKNIKSDFKTTVIVIISHNREKFKIIKRRTWNIFEAILP